MEIARCKVNSFQGNRNAWSCWEDTLAETNRQPARWMELQLISYKGVTGESTDRAVSWVEFLQALETWCGARGWVVEYESVADESCAIFYQEARSEA